jgi:hypothetical protein
MQRFYFLHLSGLASGGLWWFHDIHLRQTNVQQVAPHAVKVMLVDDFGIVEVCPPPRGIGDEFVRECLDQAESAVVRKWVQIVGATKVADGVGLGPWFNVLLLDDIVFLRGVPFDFADELHTLPTLRFVELDEQLVVEETVEFAKHPLHVVGRECPEFAEEGSHELVDTVFTHPTPRTLNDGRNLWVLAWELEQMSEVVEHVCACGVATADVVQDVLEVAETVRSALLFRNV